MFLKLKTGREREKGDSSDDDEDDNAGKLERTNRNTSPPFVLEREYLDVPQSPPPTPGTSPPPEIAVAPGPVRTSCHED